MCGPTLKGDSKLTAHLLKCVVCDQKCELQNGIDAKTLAKGYL